MTAKKSPTKESTLLKIEERYSVDRSTAEAMLAYHNAFSRAFNKIGTEAAVADTGGFETKQGMISGTAEVIADLVPVSIFSSISSIVQHGAHAAEESSQKTLSDKISQLNPTGNTELWCRFTRELADSATVEKIARSSKAIDPEHAELLAKKDVAKIKNELLHSKEDLPEISDQTELIGTDAKESINQDLIKTLTKVAKSDHHQEEHHHHSMVEMISNQTHRSREGH